MFIEQIPKNQKVTLIFDKSIIELANTKRKQEKTWLDILFIIHLIPTVDQIIIPAYTADFELRGGVSLIQSNNTLRFNKLQSEEHLKDGVANEIRKLLSIATQVRFTHNALTQLQHTQPKIKVVETRSQNKLLSALADMREYEPPQIAQKIRSFKMKYAKFDAALDVALCTNIDTPVFIITSNQEYLQRHEQNQVTSQGYPIGLATLSELVRATAGTQIEIRKELNMVDERQYCSEVMRSGYYNGMKQYPLDPATSGPGRYNTSQGMLMGESLSSIFSRGHFILQESYDPASFKYLPPSSGTNKSVLLPATRARTIPLPTATKKTVTPEVSEATVVIPPSPKLVDDEIPAVAPIELQPEFINDLELWQMLDKQGTKIHIGRLRQEFYKLDAAVEDDPVADKVITVRCGSNGSQREIQIRYQYDPTEKRLRLYAEKTGLMQIVKKISPRVPLSEGTPGRFK